jgi:hypothetical protein
VANPCEHGNETSDSIKGGEFVEELSDRFSKRTLFHAIGFMSFIFYCPIHNTKIFKIMCDVRTPFVLK